MKMNLKLKIVVFSCLALLMNYNAAFASNNIPASICASTQDYLDKLTSKYGEFPRILCIPTTEVANQLEPGVLLMIEGDTQAFSTPDLIAKQYLTLAIGKVCAPFKESELNKFSIHVTDPYLRKRGEYFSILAADPEKILFRDTSKDVDALFKQTIDAGIIKKLPRIDFETPEKTSEKIGIVGSQEDIDNISTKSNDKIKGFSHP